MSKSTREFAPVHPGQILAEDLDDAGISMNQLAKCLHVPMNRISAIVNGQRGITGDTALRLARYWGTTPEYWMSLESRYEIEVARDQQGGEQIQPRAGDLKAAADRLAEALAAAAVDEEELVQEFRQRRRQPKKVGEKLQPTAGEDVA